MQTLQNLADEIRPRLRTKTFGRPLHAFERVNSTNDVARDFAEKGASEGTAVLALEQTAGRGRLGRRWHSPRGGLYVSVVLRPVIPAEQWPLLGLAVAVGAATAAESVSTIPIMLKWPNDLLRDDRKVGGILVEAHQEFAIAGIGINASVPVSLRNESAASLDVELVPLACEVLHEVENMVEMLPNDKIVVLAQWRRRSATLGRHVRVMGREEVAGIAEDIDADGALLLRTPAGVRRVLAGDVSLR